MECIRSGKENGRTQRVFMRSLAQEAGYSLDFSVVSRERMIKASIAGNEKSHPGMMSRLLNDIGHPARVAALKKAIEGLEKHGFSWTVTSMEPGYKVDVRRAGVAGERSMARSEFANRPAWRSFPERDAAAAPW
jgi:hypothetical protein